MPSFQDSAVIFFIALLLFGPKKLPELARYVGKLMNEFRRASSEFRMQMDDEFRQIEQTEHRKKIEAMEAAAPVAPVIESSEAPLDQPITPHVEYDPDQPYIAPTAPEDIAAEAAKSEPGATSQTNSSFEMGSTEVSSVEPLPIATNGDLSMMPPSTGLPIPRNRSLDAMFDSIPQTPDPATTHHKTETSAHG